MVEETERGFFDSCKSEERYKREKGVSPVLEIPSIMGKSSLLGGPLYYSKKGNHGKLGKTEKKIIWPFAAKRMAFASNDGGGLKYASWPERGNQKKGMLCQKKGRLCLI